MQNNTDPSSSSPNVSQNVIAGSDRQRQLGAGFGIGKHFVIPRDKAAHYRPSMFAPVQIEGEISDEYVYHSWGSAISQTQAFKAGLRFVIIPRPIIISEEQYTELHKLFGTMVPLTADKALEPIPRSDLRPVF